MLASDPQSIRLKPFRCACRLQSYSLSKPAAVGVGAFPKSSNRCSGCESRKIQNQLNFKQFVWKCELSNPEIKEQQSIQLPHELNQNSLSRKAKAAAILLYAKAYVAPASITRHVASSGSSVGSSPAIKPDYQMLCILSKVSVLSVAVTAWVLEATLPYNTQMHPFSIGFADYFYFFFFN